jgi:alpha-1,2-mannosyltransferase
MTLRLCDLTNDRHLRGALALWACLAVAVCVKTATCSNPHSVYPQFAASSHHWWADESLYADYWETEQIDGYRYSPAFAVAFTPLAYLPAWLGAMIWNMAGIVLLICALHVLVRDVLPGEWPPPREGHFLALTLAGSAVGIWSGQSNAVITAAILLALAAIVRQRWWAAAMLLAVPVFIKIWPLAIVMLLVVFWPRQLAWRFAVACAVLALIPFFTRPPEKVAWQYHQWYASLTGPLQGRWDGYRDAWTIWEQLSPPADHPGDGAPPDANVTFWRQLLPPVNRHVYMALQLATAWAVLAWCWWQRGRLRSVSDGADILVCHEQSSRHGGQECLPHPDRGLATKHLLILILSIWASWQLLFGPGTEQLTYGIIAPSAAWAVMVSFAEKRARWLTVTACAMLALLPSGDIEKAAIQAFPAGKILLPVGVVLFVVWLIWHERGESRQL